MAAWTYVSSCRSVTPKMASRCASDSLASSTRRFKASEVQEHERQARRNQAKLKQAKQAYFGNLDRQHALPFHMRATKTMPRAHRLPGVSGVNQVMIREIWGKVRVPRGYHAAACAKLRHGVMRGETKRSNLTETHCFMAIFMWVTSIYTMPST